MTMTAERLSAWEAKLTELGCIPAALIGIGLAADGSKELHVFAPQDIEVPLLRKVLAQALRELAAY